MIGNSKDIGVRTSAIRTTDALIKHGDFYVVRDFSKAKNILDQVEIDNRIYHRHMGFVYIPCRPEHLSKDQIIQLANLRETHFDQLVDKRFVESVYKYVYEIMGESFSDEQKKKGVNLLDFGAGTGTFGRFIKYSGVDGLYPLTLSALDINPKYSGSRLDTYNSYSIISYDTRFPFSSNSFDVVLALYVFHYSVPENHLYEIARSLASSGFLIFNLYRPSEQFRSQLMWKLENLGFRSEKREFRSEILFHGMQHAPMEFYICRRESMEA